MSPGITRCSAGGVRSKIAPAENACSTSLLRVLVDTQSVLCGMQQQGTRRYRHSQLWPCLQTFLVCVIGVPWSELLRLWVHLDLARNPSEKAYADSEQEQLKPTRLQKHTEPAGVLSASIGQHWLREAFVRRRASAPERNHFQLLGCHSTPGQLDSTGTCGERETGWGRGKG